MPNIPKMGRAAPCGQPEKPPAKDAYPPMQAEMQKDTRQGLLTDACSNAPENPQAGHCAVFANLDKYRSWPQDPHHKKCPCGSHWGGASACQPQAKRPRQ